MSTAVAERVYPHARPRGFADWRPQAKTAELLDQVRAVLEEYAAHLPLSLRQVFYRLVASAGYQKTELAYERLCTMLNRARRAQLIPFESIRDDGVTVNAPWCFDGKPHFWRQVEQDASTYRRDRLEGQSLIVELWVEAAGMVPQAAQVADCYGIATYSAGGFDSLTAKHDAAQRVVSRKRPTLVLHVGDHDPSGLSIFDAAADDVTTMVRQFDEPGACVDFERIAVTPEQIERYGLPGAPAKKTDRRGNWSGGTVQAEALAPDVLAAEIEAAICANLDLPIYQRLLAIEAAERNELIAECARLREPGGPA